MGLTREQLDPVRRRVLEEIGACSAAVDRVLEYGRSPFALDAAPPAPVFPMEPEPHVAVWRRYAAEAGPDPLRYLQDRLPQLGVPIAKGVSGSEPYRAVSRRGAPFEDSAFGGRLALARPGDLRLSVHEHPAGALPLLSTPCREDFETLSRAFAFRSEPAPISESVNAQMVAGFINWDRVHSYRREFEAEHGPAGWNAEMARVARQEPWRFHDRVMITCARPYSAVAAADLGLPWDEAEWLRRSDLLRTEHEFTHYATKRVWGAMSLNLLDETLCDFMGMTLALGGFEADSFLRFLGLENFPRVRPDGRLHTYVAELDEEARALEASVVVRAARTLERIAEHHYDPEQRPRMLLSLAVLPLEALASAQADALFAEAWEESERLVSPPARVS